MTIHAATPYLILNGEVERALELYARAFGAKVESLQRFGDVDHTCPASTRDRVMHAELRAGDAVIMMSDGPENEGHAAAGKVSVALGFTDNEHMRRCFDVLAEKGTVVAPLFQAPWGLFGVVSDEFGVNWMLNGN